LFDLRTKQSPQIARTHIMTVNMTELAVRIQLTLHSIPNSIELNSPATLAVIESYGRVSPWPHNSRHN
jgi:hypothetical protein